MSWTATNENSWKMKRDTLEGRFNYLKELLTQTIQRNPDDMNAINGLEAQMTSIREELSGLGIVLKDALEDLREKTGNLEEPVLQLEKEFQRLQIEENTLKHQKDTREQQVSALSGRGQQNPHTISFFMMKPLSYPYYMIIVVALLYGLAFYILAQYSKSFLQSAGITTITPPITGRILMRQNYRGRIG
jgi:TolA-binding protein